MLDLRFTGVKIIIRDNLLLDRNSYSDLEYAFSHKHKVI